MDEFEKHERKRQAWMRLRAQRRRASALRGRVIALSVVCFALLWTVVFAQMITGNDPVFGEKSSVRSSSRASSRPTSKVELLAEAGDGTDADEVQVEAAKVEPEPEPEVIAPEVVEPEPLTTSQS